MAPSGSAPRTRWVLDGDVLGAGYDVRDLPMPDDYEGPVVVRLVRHSAAIGTTRRAVLWVHGYADYFFHTHVAEEFARRGYAVYGLDLRRYGRSLLPHQTPNFCLSLDEYFPDLDAAARAIEDDGHSGVVVLGHSTGGLVAALWAGDRGRGRPPALRGLALNSPFLALPVDLGHPVLTGVAERGIKLLAKARPYHALPRGGARVYGPSLHAESHGEWTYNLRWKPHQSIPIRAGWLAAVIDAQRSLAQQQLAVPTLLMTSARSARLAAWTDEVAQVDVVLAVDRVRAAGSSLGPLVELRSFEGGMHDLFLSRRPVRTEVEDALLAWLDQLVWEH